MSGWRIPSVSGGTTDDTSASPRAARRPRPRGADRTSITTAAAEEWSPDPRVNAAPSRVTRAELYRVLDTYLAALKVRDPQRVQWAPRVRNTENNVPLMVGDGLWGTITALGGYDLRFADPVTGEVGFFGTVTETTETSAYTLRLKVENGRIAGAETLIVRQSDSGSA